MNPGDVMREVAGVIARAEGVRKTWDYPPDDISVAPSGYISYPQQGEYNRTYQHGESGMTDLAIVMVAGPPGQRSTHDTLMGWVADSGPTSVVEQLEHWSWESCDDLTVNTWEIIPETVAGVVYLAVMFKATVVGPGEG